MLKRILPLLAVFVNSVLYAAGPLQSQKYFQNNGGLLDRVNPILVPEQNAAAISNFMLDDRGQLTKRSGYTILNSTGLLTTAAVTGGAYHNAASGTSFFAVVVGTTAWRTSNTFAGTYTDVTGTSTITTGATNLAQVTSLNDSLIFCNESDKPFRLSSTGNSMPLTSSIFSGAKTCSTYGSYLIIANTTESSVAFPSRVRWSDINNPDYFPANNYTDVEPNDGDKIVAVVSFQDSVYIFKKRSIHRVLITGLDGADAFIVRPIARNMGAWAKNSVKVVPGVGILFLAQNTVYRLNDDGLEPIGDPIQRTFDSLVRTEWSNSVAAVYPKRYQYWLSVSKNASTKDTILVYDYVQNAWTVYDNMHMNMLAQAEDSNGNNVLLSGDYSGNHYKQDTGTSDKPANVTTAIAASYTTTDLTLGGPEFTKNFKYLYIFYKADNVVNFTVNGFYDYNAFTSEYSATSSIGTPPAIYDTAVYDTDLYPASAVSVVRVELNRSAKAIKLQFQQTGTGATTSILGWSIVYSMEDWRE